MALYGKFVVNDAQFSPLSFPGIGTWMAFSGNGQYRNHGGCAGVPDNGPLPSGRYWIVDRPGGGIGTTAVNMFKDIASGVRHADWFSLYRDDGQIDDYTWVNGVRRGLFRLHPIGNAGLSEGCITFQHPSEFYVLRNCLLRTTKIKIPGSDLSAYGTIEVIADGKTCPVAG